MSHQRWIWGSVHHIAPLTSTNKASPRVSTKNLEKKMKITKTDTAQLNYILHDHPACVKTLLKCYTVLIFIIHYYRRQRSCCKVMFLHLSVILFAVGGGSLCPSMHHACHMTGRYLSDLCVGGCLSRRSLSRGSLSRGFLCRRSLCRGSLCRGSLSKRSLCRGFSVQGVSVQGVSVQGVSVQGVSVQGSLSKRSLLGRTRPALHGTDNKRVVRILLEYFLVIH